MALLLGLAMLPAGAIAMQVGLNAVAAREAAYEETVSRRALQSISTERATIDEIREMVRVLATTPALHRLNADNCRRWLADVATRYPYVASISVIGPQGEIRCSYPAVEPNLRSPPTALRERAHDRNAFTLGYVPRGAITQEPVVAALEPIFEGERRVGFVGVSITIEALTELLDRSREVDHAFAALIDSRGEIVASSTANRERFELPSSEQLRQSLSDDAQFVRLRDGSAVVVPLNAPDLYELLAWPSEQPTWRRWAAVGLSIAAPLLIWMLAIAAGWFAIEVFVARPLSSLESAARAFARGEDLPDPPALQTAPEEIRSLRRTMAAMAKTLRGREQRLIEALAEERTLLREVHHRVKNNLQMVSSLLNIQARNARDDSEAWGLARAHDRVQLLALVHQRIYASGEVRELRVDDLVADVARNLLQSRGAAAKEIVLSLHLDPVRSSVDRAVPLTFLIGEGVSNALDVLGDAGSAELRLFLHQSEDGEVRIAVDSDRESGPAGPGHFAQSGRLVEAFARQLGAQVGRNAERPFMLWALAPPPRGQQAVS